MSFDSLSPAQRHRGARIPSDFLSELLSRADIVDVVGRSVELKKAGANLAGLCPFHSERSASFTVSPSKQFYHCFGCGAHGSALTFLMENDGMPFREAVKTLAQSVGLKLPEPVAQTVGEEQPIEHAARVRLFAAMNRAKDHFAASLKTSPAARRYLREERSLDPKMASRFVIGYAEPGWRGLGDAFADYATSTDLVMAGLVREKTKEDGKTARYDWFRDRIMFGVRDMRGRLVAWGGRSISGETPKYLNSPDTPIFDKSEILFGAFEAKDDIRRLGEVLVLEGYMGVIMLAQHGVPNAVASMGTSFTASHLNRALQMATKVVFCFDGDDAGRLAARRALAMVSSFLDDTHDVRFMMLPDGMDPDDFVRKHGGPEFMRLKAQAPGYSDFLIQCCREDVGIDTSSPQSASADARAKFSALALGLTAKLPYGSQRRKLLERQIAAETRSVGSAQRSLSLAQASRSQDTTLWARLHTAAGIARATALSVREDIIPLLNEDNVQETHLRDLLNQLADAAHDAQDQVAHPQYLAMRDLLNSGVELIGRERAREVREEIDRLHAAGQIDDAAYVKQLAALRSSSRAAGANQLATS